MWLFFPPSLPLLCSLRACCMTMSRRSGPYIYSGSACCFCALQTDAPSNLFIHGWAMGVSHCHFMASTQRLPMSSTVIGVCVCVCVRTCTHEHMPAYSSFWNAISTPCNKFRLHANEPDVFCLLAFNLNPEMTECGRTLASREASCNLNYSVFPSSFFFFLISSHPSATN